MRPINNSIFSKKQLTDLNKLSSNTPGANHININDIHNFKKILLNKSPYRFSSKLKKPFCNILEDKFKTYLNRKYFLLLSSGTAALHAALNSFNLSPSDEVILPSYGWSSDLMMVVGSKAKPVLAPIDKNLGLDIKSLNNIISKKTRVIIAIHMRGKVCEIEKICSLAKKKGIKVIEDCSQCFGGMLNSKTVGSFGDIATFSFQFNKLLTSGEGGAVATNSNNLFQKMNNFHDLGMGRAFGEKDPIGIMAKSFGLNYHFNELSAALLLTQFNKKKMILDNLRKNHKKILNIFKEVNKNFTIMKFYMPLNPKGFVDNYAFFIFQIIDNKDTKVLKDTFKKYNINLNQMRDLDGHNYKSWIKFLEKFKIKYKKFHLEESEKILDSFFFIEVNSLKYI